MTGTLADYLVTAIADSDFDPATGELAWAAFSGEAALQSALDGRGTMPTVPSPSSHVPPMAGTYLKSITIEGFRGIGPTSRLDLNAGPGLTLVIGRNGSGKSSFAEGLEMLLTGRNQRWANRPVEWQGAWRNLHQRSTAKITAEFQQESNTRSTIVERRWDANAGLEDSTSFAQVHGKSRGTIAALGWDSALSSVRPILSYNELGSLIDEGPSKLYDALAAVLGLDELNDAIERLKKAATQLAKAQRESKKELKERILPALASIDDDRARVAHDLLSRKPPNLEGAQALVTGTDADGSGDLRILQALAALECPRPDEVDIAGRRLLAADVAATLVGATEAGYARKLANILDQALSFHLHAGHQSCPVCGVGTLDEGWRTSTTEELARLRSTAAAAYEVQAELARSRAALLALLTPAPEVLGRAIEAGLEASNVMIAWKSLFAYAAEPDSATLAAGIRQAATDLADSLELLADEARSELNKREDAWRPSALMLSSWLDRSQKAEESAAHLDAVKGAGAWLQDQVEELRNERFEPIAERATAIFDMMRHDSNVQLESVELEGTGTRRRVALKVTVDGVDGSALGVMSQGELNALALSLFLPRATMEESPFRFVVIDDPVQAMDPNRVDGLARALEQAAKTRQVIVFTHDERLRAATSRLGVAASVIEVQRRENSFVEARLTDEPISRYLDDARALALTHELPEDVKARVLPGYLRLAVEAAGHEVVWRRRLAAGQTHQAIETLLFDKKTKPLVALAIFDDATKAGDVLTKLNSWDRRLADAYRSLNEGVHGAPPGGFGILIDATGDLVDRIRMLS